MGVIKDEKGITILKNDSVNDMNILIRQAMKEEIALSGADLSGANLSGADLSGADLSGAYLSGANLSVANLKYVKIRSTDIKKLISALKISICD